MELLFSFLLPLVAGYVASIYTWPWIRAKWNGLEAEAAALKAKADALVAKVKS